VNDPPITHVTTSKDKLPMSTANHKRHLQVIQLCNSH